MKKGMSVFYIDPKNTIGGLLPSLASGHSAEHLITSV